MSAAPTGEYEHPMLAGLAHARDAMKCLAGEPLFIPWRLGDKKLVRPILAMNCFQAPKNS